MLFVQMNHVLTTSLFRKKFYLSTKIESKIDFLELEFKPLLQIGFNDYPNFLRIKTLIEEELFIDVHA